jgi:hypothetical protein
MSSLPARAFDLNGAWADDAAVCSKIFVKKNNSISIARNADFYGSGFVVNGNTIKGKMATCTIKVRKQEADQVNLIAVCSTDIALATTQFALKIEGDDKIARLFSGMPEMTMRYVRCPP